MNKPVIFFAAAMVLATTVSYAQSTTNSTAPPASNQTKQSQGTQAGDQSKESKNAPGDQKHNAGTHSPNQNSDNKAAQSADQAGNAGTPSTDQKANTGNSSANQNKQGQSSTQSATPSNPNPAGQGGSTNGDVKSSDRPGGAANDNANDVGKYAENEDSKSMLNSREAKAERQKNLTVSDTTLKDGSGSSPKNMKNNTGKTGNYKNNDAKQSIDRP